MRFKLLIGKHVQKAPDGKGSVTYRPGDVVESDKDLTRLNAAGGSPKFERLGESRQSRGEPRENQVQTTAAHPPATNLTGGPAPFAHDKPEEKKGEEKKAEGKAEPKAEPARKRVDDHQLDKMSVQDLKALADEEEIDLRGSNNKTDIVKIIRDTRKAGDLK